MKKLTFFLICFCLLFSPLFVTPTLAAIENDVITNINVQGNQRVEAETVKSYMAISAYQQFDQQAVDESIKRLYATGLFANVAIIRHGQTLQVNLTENPLINEVAFEGNKRIKKEDILAEITLKPHTVYAKSRLQNDVSRILDIYHKSGRFAVTVNPKIIQLPQNRVNLVFEINEGPKTPIKSIEFIGNTQFSDTKLRAAINTKEARWYRFFSSNDTYDPDRIDYDKELLRKFYTSQGYADFKIISAIAALTPNRDGFILTYTLDAGEKYTFGKITTETTLKKLKTEDLKKDIKTVQWELFNSSFIEDSVDKMILHLSDLGYAFVDINPVFKRNIANHTVDITYKIQEGHRVYVNRINITGNVRTMDEVIRREFRLGEGDPYNAAQVRRSEQRIKNLGFFDKVNVTNAKTDSPDKVDVNVDVTEKSTGEINFGVGYSTTDGALATIGIRERNLLGKGQDLALTLEEAQRQSNIDLSYTEPYFMGYDLSAGTDIFHTTTDNLTYSEYDSKSTGFTLRSSYDLTEYLRHTVHYTLKDDDIYNVQSTASIYIIDEEGDATTSMIGQTFLYDRRDNKFNPTTGYFVRYNQDLAGLGGDTRYFRNEIRTGYFIPLFKKTSDMVLQLSANAGYIVGLDKTEVRINDRFFVGGDDLRGFRIGGIGPRDTSTSDALGGDEYYVGSVELHFPLGLPKELDFAGEVFTDMGSLLHSDSHGPTVAEDSLMRVSVGTGIAWGSPMGPIHIDLAAPIIKESYDRTQIFRFSFGTRF